MPSFSNTNASAPRTQQFRTIANETYDVAIIGGGVSGSRLYYELCQRGYRTLLIERGDFGCGTSQASGMMIWGGLLYLKNLDFRTVVKLCRARDQLIDRHPGMVEACRFRYLPCARGGRNRNFVFSALLLYWLLGSWQRQLPRGESQYAEIDLLMPGKFLPSLTYEEAFLNLSDCRFVLEWLMGFRPGRVQAVNYCNVVQNSDADGLWHLDLRDGLHGNEASCRARYVVNAAGVWADQVNDHFGIQSPYRHVFSKGVYLNLPRPKSHESALIFEMGKHGDSQCYVPWGPVSMWGPTETTVNDLNEGFRPAAGDVEFLLDMANRNLSTQYEASDVVSLRCGVRPLAVRRDFNRDVYPLDLSRKHLIHLDLERRFATLYGGKLTSCGLMAAELSDRLSARLTPGRNETIPARSVPRTTFPELEEAVAAPEWCRDREACVSLQDYLRRRTNLAQWVPNGGFGRNWQHQTALAEIATVFHGNEAPTAVANYRKLTENNLLNTI